MEFKIDTKPTYTHITPLYGVLDANMAAALHEKRTELVSEGSQNFLIDLSACHEAKEDAVAPLLELHERSYDDGQSLVFTQPTDAVLKVLRETEADQILNIAPKVIEAIDIISMEILERDLFGEEEG